MGYSISAPVENKESYNKMKKFLKENYIHPKEFIYSGIGTKLDYDKSKLKIGFDYNAGAPSIEKDWGWTIVKWIATKVGKVKSFNGEQPEKYIRYDGMEFFPIKDIHSEDRISGELLEQLNILSEKWDDYESD